MAKEQRRNNDVEFPSRNVRIPASSLAKGLLASDSPITQIHDFEPKPRIKQTKSIVFEPETQKVHKSSYLAGLVGLCLAKY